MPGAGRIVLRSKRLPIADLDRRQRVARSNPNLLHLEHEGAHLDTNHSGGAF
jgi:hypothetical protein